MTPELRERLLYFSNKTDTFTRYNHIVVTGVDDGASEVTLALTPESLNHWESPHGGALFTMCDVACGVAAVSLRQERCVTVNLTMDFLAAGPSAGRLIAAGRVDRAGGKMCFCSAQVHDDSGTLIAAAHSVMYFTGGALPL